MKSKEFWIIVGFVAFVVFVAWQCNGAPLVVK